jgi:hypothetical protein
VKLEGLLSVFMELYLDQVVLGFWLMDITELCKCGRNRVAITNIGIQGLV